MAVILLATPAFAADGPVGSYHATEGPELAANLELTADGHFRYELAYGALDEQAAGSWRRENGAIHLYTEPKPKPATFAIDSITASGDAPLTLLVSWPNGGGGIAGVDFRLGFDSGEPVTGYTQDYGWTLDPAEKRKPVWIELVEPIHAIVSPRFPIANPRTNSLRFTFIPNDLGTVDFAGNAVDVAGDTLVLHHPNGLLHFVRNKD